MGNCSEPSLGPEDEEIEECDTGACHSIKSLVERNGPRSILRQNNMDAAIGDQLWPNGIIPYEMDSSLDYNRKRIMKAMRTIEYHSTIEFVERSYEEVYLKITKDDGCYFYRGGVGQPKVSLGIGCESYGTVLHELLHAIGFPHEQRRPDRDKYIVIHWENIERGQEPQFRKLKPHQYKWSELPFDYDSVMLYGEYAFSKNRRKTIEARNGRHLPHNRSGLSELDKRKLSLL